jgi:hypothetical protein
LKTT